MNAIDEVKRFVTLFLETNGALVNKISDDIIEAVLSEKLANQLSITDFTTIVYKKELAGEYQNTVFIMPGSPILKEMVQISKNKGGYVEHFVTGLNLEIANVQQKIERNIKFINCRLNLLSMEKAIYGTAIFNYKVSYITEDKIETIIQIPVDLYSLGMDFKIFENYNRFFFEEKYDGELELGEIKPVEEVYKASKKNLLRKIDRDIKIVKGNEKKKLNREIERITSFYHQNILEHETKIKKNNIDDAYRSKIRSKIELLEIDLRNKIDDAIHKYRVNVEIELINVEMVFQPKLTCNYLIEDKQGKIETKLFWDPVTRKVELPFCSNCFQMKNTFFINSSNSLLCDECENMI